jgi:hypothetical protein
MRHVPLSWFIICSISMAAFSGAGEAKAASGADPIAYCKLAGTLDMPGMDYHGIPVPSWMVKALYTPEAIAAQKASGLDPAKTIVWRCADGKVVACVQGNSPQCGKASTSKTPTKGMIAFCAATPGAEVIPLSAIGHEDPMIYEWTCKDKTPTIVKQIFKVDKQGYPAELWQTVTH